jgi:L-lactate dehydrogenase complex protein LldF
VCAACNEVCPVNIPIPDLLLRLRDRAKRAHAPLAAAGTPPLGGWAVMAASPAAWKAALLGGKMLNLVPHKLVPVPAMQAWTEKRTIPKWQGGEFRRWMKGRAKS